MVCAAVVFSRLEGTWGDELKFLGAKTRLVTNDKPIPRLGLLAALIGS